MSEQFVITAIDALHAEQRLWITADIRVGLICNEGAVLCQRRATERFGWGDVFKPLLPNTANSIAHPRKDRKKSIEYFVRRLP